MARLMHEMKDLADKPAEGITVRRQPVSEANDRVRSGHTRLSHPRSVHTRRQQRHTATLRRPQRAACEPHPRES